LPSTWRKTGVTKGKEANMHMGDMRRGIVAFVSMLADTIPVAAGIAMTYKMRKQNNVVLCYFGDGATSRGDWHEGLNLASVQKAPVVYICNNNYYAYSTPLRSRWLLRISLFVVRRMPCRDNDGNDAIEVFKATQEAVRLARQGGGPSLLECKTFRMTGIRRMTTSSTFQRALRRVGKERSDP
jgi:pyruvate dehydrogenase E1 component alpha subunit